MSFPQAKFLAKSPEQQAKKCSDALRTAVLRLGEDWRQTLADYNLMVQWLGEPERCVVPDRLSLPEARAHYRYWRTLSNLPLQRDMAPDGEESDRSEALSPPLPWWVLAHNLRSAYNTGSVLRTIDCFGLAGAWLSGHTPAADHPGVKSSAMGAGAWIPTKRIADPLATLQEWRDQGNAIVALELTADAVALQDFWWPTQGLLLLGNEELGVAPEILALATHKVFIPMHGRKNSLNVSSAFAVTAAALRNSALPQ